MDAYLESLVRKGEEVVEEAPVQVEEPEVEVTEEVVTEPKVAAEPEVAGDEPEVEVEPEPEVEVTEEVEEDGQPDDDKESEEESPYKDGEVIFVHNIRVFKTPDTKQIAKNVSGNVTYLGKIGDFYIINYMRHGFGIVRGYTLSELK